MSPKTSHFTEGMTRAGRDVRRTLSFAVATATSTSFPTAPLSIRERRDFLRGYATGLLQALSETRAPGAPRYPQERNQEGATP